MVRILKWSNRVYFIGLFEEDLWPTLSRHAFAWRAEDRSTVRVAIGSKVYAADQIIGACAGTAFRPSDWTSQPVKYVRVCQAARGFARIRKVTVYEVRNGRFYALD